MRGLRRPAVVAWCVFALAVAATVVGWSLQYRAAGAGGGVELDALIGQWSFGLVTLLFAAVGGLLASRRPGNPIGWLFLLSGLTDPVHIAATHTARLGAEVGGAVAALSDVAAVVGAVLSQPGPGLVMLVFLLFPTGRLLSGRWRGVVVAVVSWMALAGLVALVVPGPVFADRAVVDAGAALSVGRGAVRATEQLVGLALGPLAAICAGSLLLRFRRSRGMERQQIKWLLLSALLLAVTFVTIAAAVASSVDPDRLFGGAFYFVVFLPAVASAPIAAGFAVLRYRLYDIDRIISRTVAYLVVTSILVGVYVGLVLLLQRAFAPLVAGSDLVVAASTLAVAAAFGPVRRRVQDLVDRRFNRRRYDAARIIESFNHRLRDEVDLDAFAAELDTAVRRTIQPATASIWLAPAGSA